MREDLRVEESQEDPERLLRGKLNQETAKIPWSGLQRFFAQGRVVAVAPEMDLVEVAAMAANDRSSELAACMAEGRVGRVSDAQARRWVESDALLWTVVVKPWVFVQEPARAVAAQIH
jgi:hypothetical protein